MSEIDDLDEPQRDEPPPEGEPEPEPEPTDPPSLWRRLDAAYLAAFVAQMGSASSYNTLKIATAQIGDTWRPDDPDWTHPGLLLVSNEADEQHAGHQGAAAIRVTVTYRYYAAATAEATSHAEAKQAAQTLHQRLIATLKTWPAIMAAAAAADPLSTETPLTQRFDRSWIDVRGRQASRAAKFYAIAVAAWTVDATL
jgi:hypothetical protein